MQSRVLIDGDVEAYIPDLPVLVSYAAQFA
ncbi:MAG: hypothetical protein KatS3mg121_0734 [Gammaproteobacteria bacterium]|nr:MAG: hypothetical protein KatS3mg121_0734 [Gammaproteobacteria bacterium]